MSPQQRGTPHCMAGCARLSSRSLTEEFLSCYARHVVDHRFASSPARRLRSSRKRGPTFVRSMVRCSRVEKLESLVRSECPGEVWVPVLCSVRVTRSIWQFAMVLPRVWGDLESVSATTRQHAEKPSYQAGLFRFHVRTSSGRFSSVSRGNDADRSYACTTYIPGIWPSDLG